MAINFAIYTSAPIPFGGTSPDPTSSDSGLWSPLLCTLIYTPTSAVLVDCPASIAGTNDLADWLDATLPKGCTLKYFVASHAHGDHIFGFPVLKSRFSAVLPVATANVAAGIDGQYAPELYENVWKPNFPTTPKGTGLPEEKARFAPLSASNTIDLDGHIIKAIDVGHGDTHAACFIHVADLGLVVASDIVYNRDCHQYLGEATTPATRQQWIDALDEIARFEPQILVPGHTFAPQTKPDRTVAKDMLEGTKEYIRAFEEELVKADSSDDLFQRVRARYPSRWNLWILGYSTQMGFSNRN